MQFLLMSALLLASVAPVPTSDTKKLEGEWRIIYAEENGVEDKIPKDKVFTYSFSNGKLSTKIDGKVASEGKYKIDASKKPKEIDFTMTEDDYGIYKLESDELTICMSTTKMKKDRPKEFKTKEGSKTVLIKLKKEK